MTNAAYPGVQLSWQRILAIAQNQPDPAAEINFEDQLEADDLPQGQDTSMSPYLSRLHCMSTALQNLFIITGQDEGYAAFISTMTTELKYDCPVSMAFLKHIIDFSEIPTKTVLENISKRFLEQIDNVKRTDGRVVVTQLFINQNIMWSMLAQKYAGNLIESMWVDQIGDILIKSLVDDSLDLILRLFSLLALESFAVTGSIKEKLTDQCGIIHVLERVLEEVELKMSIVQGVQQQQSPLLSEADTSPDLTLASVKRQSFSGRKIYQDLKYAFLTYKTKLKEKSNIKKKRQSAISTIRGISDNQTSDKYFSFPSTTAAMITQPIIPKAEQERNTWFELMQLRHSLWWSVEHVFKIERLQTQDKYNSREVALTQIDRTGHCKLSEDCLEVRNDTHFFESVRANTCIANRGRWYYEVLLLTSGVMQIGWGTSKCVLSPQEGSGIGDDRNGFAFDTYRSAIWSAGERVYSKYNDKVRCKAGDVLGCFIDLDERKCAFYMNGQDSGLAAGFDRLNLEEDTITLGLFPTISLTGYQHVLVNFGSQPWLFSPPVTHFKAVSEAAVVEPSSEKDNEPIEYEWDGPICTICFSEAKDTLLLPCGHDGFGRNCADALIACPLCRAEIKERVMSNNPTENAI